MVRFMRSTCPFVQGCRGLVSRWATSFWAQASSKAWARNSCWRASIALISAGVQVLPLGSVKWVPLEVGAIVGENRMHPVRHSRDQVSEEVAGNAASDPLMQLNKGKLGRAVDRNQQIELALLGSDFRDIGVEVADRGALELGSAWLVAVCVGQPRDAVPLQTAVQA